MRKFINLLIILSISSPAFTQLSPGQIGNDQSICYGSAAMTLTFTTQPSGGTTPYIYRWERSNDDGLNYSEISGRGAGHETFSPPVLARTASFRCRVTDALGAVAYAYDNLGTAVTITVSSILTSGSIETTQTTIFGGTTPDPITQLGTPSGGGGSWSYQWQNSADGLYWSDIPGATNAEYLPSSIIADTWYRRWVIDESCGSTASNAIKISVNPITLYTSETPLGRSFAYEPRDFGTEFQVLMSGFITKVRLYCDPLEGGVHQIRLWKQNDQLIYDQVGEMIEWDFPVGTVGWIERDITPIAVEADRNYIISITNGTGPSFVSVSSSPFSIEYPENQYVRYLRGLFGATPGNVPDNPQGGISYFRDIVFVPFSPGNAGMNQSICYNTTPALLAQTAAPSGGSGGYIFQWQNSPNGLAWTDIPGATSQNYSPTALTVSTYYRRAVTSGNLTAYGNQFLITVDPEFTLAQLNSDITIYENTSTYFNVVLTGGTAPYTINYTRDGTPQSAVTNYLSGTDIYTGILAAQENPYTYVLTSVTDAFGCEVQSLGNPFSITVSGTYQGSASSKALVIVNSTSAPYYDEYNIYLKPYLDWFGVPYETCDINSMSLPAFGNYSVIILGHRNVYPSGGYPIAELETAIPAGAGLYSFDPHLFDYASAFNVSGTTHPAVTSSQIDLITNHYITQYHQTDTYNDTSDVIKLYQNTPQPTITINETNFSLVGGIDLATMSDGVNTEPLLEVATYGTGRIVKWSSYDWAFDAKLGPVMGMDDIVWRSIVWAARKPFVMQGLPPMITMRVDDVLGEWGGSSIAEDLEWLKISNEYGFIPWCGTFLSNMRQDIIDTLRLLTNNKLTTTSPHSFNTENAIYSDNDDVGIDVLQNVIDARAFYENNDLPMSKYIVPHEYRINSDIEIQEVLTEISNMGVEFIGIPIPYYVYQDPDFYPGEMLNCGPYKINRPGYLAGNKALFYGGNVNWEGNDFFISITETRDLYYEWFPTSFVLPTTAKAINQLRRALNSMVLPTLFTHEYQLQVIQPLGWRQTLAGITSFINSSYNPVYKSMDDAVKYVRAKENINLTNVTVDNELVSISCTGVNDMATQCYLFNESDNMISFRLITLPQVSSNTVPVTVGILNN